MITDEQLAAEITKAEQRITVLERQMETGQRQLDQVARALLAAKGGLLALTALKEETKADASTPVEDGAAT